MRLVALFLLAGGLVLPAQSMPDRLRSLVERAHAAEQQDRLDEAISLYEEILRLRPAWASAELNLGLAYHSRGSYLPSIRVLTDALKHEPNLHSAYLFRGASYFHTGQYDEAVRDLNQYLKHEPGSAEALSLLANTHIVRKDPANAAVAYASLARTTGEPAAYFQLSECYVQLARNAFTLLSGEEARPYRIRVPEDERSGELAACEVAGDAELTAARCAADRGEFESATRTLIAISRRPKLSSEKIYQSLGAYRRLARAAVAKLLAVAPGSPWAALLRAQSADQVGDTDTAEKQYELAIASPGAGLEVYVRFGQFQAKHSRFERALALYQKALTLEPGNPRVMGLIGEVHALEDRSETAIPFLEAAVRANARETQTRLYLAQALLKVNRTSDAVKILEAAPEDPDGRIHYLLGRTYQQQGEKEKARSAMEEFRKRKGGAANP
jgi:tetratricopeptide (TPR) repeat protein